MPSHSETPAAATSNFGEAAGTGYSQESSSYYRGKKFARNEDDRSSEYRSPDMGEKIRIWSHKADNWRYVHAKYIDDQIPKGTPGQDDERAWTDYKDQRWFHHDERNEVPGPDKEGTSDSSSYVWADYNQSKEKSKDSSSNGNNDDSSNKNVSQEKGDGSTSGKKEKPKKWYYHHRERDDASSISGYRTYCSDEEDDSDDPRELRALKEGDVPRWNGTDLSRRMYYRKVDMWALSTGIPPRHRAIRLLQNLSGDAQMKMEHVDAKSLKKKDGIQLFKRPAGKGV